MKPAAEKDDNTPITPGGHDTTHARPVFFAQVLKDYIISK